MSYIDFLQKNIFDKLRMKDTGMDSPAPILYHRAAGYTPKPQGIENTNYIDMTIPYAAGALYSTTGDMLKWSLGLFGGKLLKPESLTKMTTPFLHDYAYGLGVVKENGRTRIEHGGGIEGFNTHISYYPDDKMTVVVLSNLNGPADEIANKLGTVAHNEAVVLPTERREVPVAPAVLQQYVGAYVLGDVTSTVTLEGSQLSIQLTGQPKFPMFPETETRFFLKVVDAELDFVKDASGKVTKAVLHQNGQDTEWIRK